MRKPPVTADGQQKPASHSASIGDFVRLFASVKHHLSGDSTSIEAVLVLSERVAKLLFQHIKLFQPLVDSLVSGQCFLGGTSVSFTDVVIGRLALGVSSVAFVSNNQFICSKPTL